MVGPGVVLLALAGLGAGNAAYFVAVERRWMRPDPRWLPRVCRMDEATCVRIVDTDYARVFGPSNALLGLVWYALVAMAGVVAMGESEVPGRWGLIAVSAGTVLLGVYLIWALFARLRTPCPLCLVGHAINAAILVTLVVA